MFAQKFEGMLSV